MASASSASAARVNSSAVAGAPVRARSARVARQGTCATPPRASRQPRTVPSPPTSSAAASDTSANANEARSRTLRYVDRPGGGDGSSTEVIRSPGRSTVSRSGWSPGSRCSPGIATTRLPSGPVTCTRASSAASATAMSEGWVATHWVAAFSPAECPRMARLLWSPATAGQPDPGCRLLHGLVTSWK